MYRLVEVIMVIIYIILLYNGWIEIRRLVIFLVIILIISSYGLIREVVDYNLEWWINNLMEREEEIVKKKLIKYIEIMLKISIIINPVLYSIIWMEKKLIYFFRWINYYWFNYMWINKVIYFIIMKMIIKPILLIYYYFYKLLGRWKEMTFVELIFRKAEGLIISIVIMSDIYKSVINYLGYEKIIIISYIIIIIMCVLEDVIFKYLIKDFRMFINYIIKLKNKNTIIFDIKGKILKILKEKYNILEDNEKEVSKLNNYYLDSAGKEIFKDLSLYGWFFLSIDDKKQIFKEIKYQPSFVIYCLLYDIFFKNSDLFFYYNILINLKDETEKEIILNIINEYKELWKKILFEIWEIEDYLGIDSYKYIKYVDDYYRLDQDIEEYKYYEEENFKVENKVEKEKYKDLKENFDYYSVLLWQINRIKDKYMNIGEKIKEKNNINNIFAEDEEFNKFMKEELENWLKNCRKEWEDKIKKR